jgi:hypothetical protein
MKKVLRPFWSFDVTKTEAWLSAMSKKGYQLVKLNHWTHTFYFHHSEPKMTTYRVAYDKAKNVSLSKSLSDEGWINISQSGKWSIISNEKPTNLLKTSTVRDGIINHNKKIMYIYSGILLYFTFMAIMNLTLIGVTFLQEDQIEIVDSPWWLLTYSLLIVTIAVYLIGVYAVTKIIKTNKELQNEGSNSTLNGNNLTKSLTKDQEKQLKRSTQIIKKRKFAWMYSPDQLEQWLESMEEQGYNLYRVSKLGTAFYFLKSRPRKVSYCVDYQNISNEDYYQIHKESGWHSFFKSPSSIQKWTIWAKKYSEGEEKPQLYTDTQHRLKHAKRVAKTYTILFLPITIMYILLLGVFLADLLYGNGSKINLVNTFMFLLTIILFGSFTVRSWLYFFRLKKEQNYDS